MKPYRGMHLAAAVLLAALPLASCGNADKYAESGTITLTSDVTTVEAKKEVVFTVVGIPTKTTTTTAQAKTILEECEMDLEYRSDGAGVNQSWMNVPGSGPTRVFKLLPRETGTLNVLARGKCVGSNENWEYSGQVAVTVSDKTLPEVTAITLAANPTSVAKNKPVTFTLGATTKNGATNSDKCTLNLSYQYSGAGFGVTTVYPAYIGQFILTPTAVGTLTVTAHGWCSENASAAIEKTTTVEVTAIALPKVTSVTLTPSPNPYSIASGTGVDFTLAATADALCTVKLSYTYSGAGLALVTVNPAPPGVFNLAPVAAGTLTVSATGWCVENPSAVVSATTANVTITL